MTLTSNHEDRAGQAPRGSGRRRSLGLRLTAGLALSLGLAVVAAGCGGSGGPGADGSGSNTGNHAAASSSGTAMAQFVAYTVCMRAHGIKDFPDPTTSPGGGVSFQMNGGPGSDLDHNNPRYIAANRACQGLLPGGGRGGQPNLSPQQIAAEVTWARCMRTHGLPGFPDPNSQGVFDSGKFDENSPGFQTASTACKSVQPSGPTPVEPGRP